MTETVLFLLENCWKAFIRLKDKNKKVILVTIIFGEPKIITISLQGSDQKRIKHKTLDKEINVLNEKNQKLL